MVNVVVAIATLLLAASVQAAPLAPLERNLSYKVLMRTGWTAGKNATIKLGGMINRLGLPVFEVDESGNPTDTPAISHNPDFSSLLETTGPFGAKKLFMVTQFEAPGPSSEYVIELYQAPDGTLVPKSLKAVDWSAHGGLWTPCAGSRTPWGSHIGGEEYEPDARPFAEATTLAELKSKLGGGWGAVQNFMSYWDLYPADLTHDLIKAKFNPYRYGHIHETRVDYKGNITPLKWLTLGRAAWEMAYVMPDQKTVYMTDDGTNVGFYKFVATKAGDLSAGTLYAGKFTQTAATNGGTFTIEWITLGSGNNKDLRTMMTTLVFSDIFETATWTDGTGCPTGFTSVNEGGRAVQCLKLKEGKATAAAFFETRRYAGMLGATTEFSKWEGITFDTKRQALYTSMSAIRYGMEDNKKSGASSTQYDKGGNNDVKVPFNPCGCVYSLPVDAALSATTMTGLVCGAPNPIYQKTCPSPADPDVPCDSQNICNIDMIASPDNVAYVPEYDTLIIGEDTSEHQNDVMWQYDFTSTNITRMFSTPYGAETTSPYWYGNIGGNSYLMAVVQHPYGESDEAMVNEPDSTGLEAWIGYITWKTVPKATGMQFSTLSFPVTEEEKHNPRVSSKVTIYRGDRTVVPLAKQPKKPVKGRRAMA